MSTTKFDYVDYSLLEKFIENLDHRMKDHLTILASGGWETESEARTHVGYIRACRDLRDTLKNLLDAYGTPS